MSHDARFLAPAAQEALRLRVVSAIREEGISQTEAGRRFGVARGTVNRWMGVATRGGLRSLRAKKRGRPSSIRLKPHQAATTVQAILGGCPDQLRMPFALWTREAVQHLIEHRFGVELSVWTVGRYLRRWGMSPQKPLKRAFERDPKATRVWLERDYPALREQAKRDGAEIYWGDEMGIRSDHQTGTSWGRVGETPVVPGPGRRFGCNMISAITNRGLLAFMVFHGSGTDRVFVRFLRRLLRHAKRRVLLIVDQHSIHRSARVKRFLRAAEGRLDLAFLPPYHPELNPDELLNNDVKSNAVGRRRAADSNELLSNVRGYLRSTQRQPDIVKRYFQEFHVRYAAG